jgi:hypothetical protein
MMQRSLFLLALSLLSFCVCRPLSAATISVEYGSGSSQFAAPGSTGTFEIQFNTGPENRTFQNGGIGLALTLSTPGVIEFTGAQIINGGRWAVLGPIDVTANSTGTLNAFSLSTPGLPSGFDIVYATVDYKVIGRGSTTINVGVSGEDPLFDGTVPPFGADVTSEFAFWGNVFTNPEPSSMVLATIGCAAVILRRRNG